MEALRAYEGPRGLAYLLIICSALGPSAGALYLLDSAQFLSMDWPQLLILVGTAGGLALLLGQLTCLCVDMALPRDKTDEGRLLSLQIMLGIGGGYSLAVQLGVLAWVSAGGGSFRQYFQTTLWVLGPVLVLTMIRTLLKVGRKS